MMRGVRHGASRRTRFRNPLDFTWISDFRLDFWISRGFPDFKVDFWISNGFLDFKWISGFQNGFLDFTVHFTDCAVDFTVDFWISEWILDL